MAYTIEQLRPNIHTFTFNDISAGWEQWVLLSSDRHHDSAHCDHKLELRHLDEAKRRQALVLDFGDLFDAMQGKHDPRQDKSALRKEHLRRAYLDTLVKTAAEFYAPYAPQFGVIALGNHETAVIDRHGTNLVDALVSRLNADHGGKCFAGGYGGWIRFLFNVQSTVRSQLRLKYFHGAGGGGPVTRGVIQTNRQAVYLPDADIVVNGHTHDSWLVPIARERLSIHGRQVHDLQHHVRTATYKDEYGDGAGGWHVESGKPPKPLGAVWMRMFLSPGRGGGIEVEFTQALR